MRPRHTARFRPAFLALPVFLAGLSAGEARSATTRLPGDPRPVQLFVTGGAAVPALTTGFKVRHNEKVEWGLRGGVGPDDMTQVDARLNVFLCDHEPSPRACTYMGPEFLYTHEESNGTFDLGYLHLMAGREYRLTPRLRWLWEVGGGVLVYHRFSGGGAPILLPIGAMARAELLFRVF